MPHSLKKLYAPLPPWFETLPGHLPLTACPVPSLSGLYSPPLHLSFKFIVLSELITIIWTMNSSPFNPIEPIYIPPILFDLSSIHNTQPLDVPQWKRPFSKWFFFTDHLNLIFIRLQFLCIVISCSQVLLKCSLAALQMLFSCSLDDLYLLFIWSLSALQLLFSNSSQLAL